MLIAEKGSLDCQIVDLDLTYAFLIQINDLD